jgi:diaminopimelate epimerase
MIIEFHKYQATGNDFIIIDDRDNNFDIHDSILIQSLCERKMGIGADGLIVLRNHNEYDFRMIYFNSDGFESTLCGNGSRCIVSFANLLDISSNKIMFMAIDGMHEASIDDDEVSIKFKDIKKIDYDNKYIIIDSGSPHLVNIVENVDNINIDLEGASIRNMPKYKSKGINVNFIEHDNHIKIRTYERGVESETHSCGTGAVASAIALYHSGLIEENIISLISRGGELSVMFEEFNGIYRNIWLTGSVNLVYIGEFEC